MRERRLFKKWTVAAFWLATVSLSGGTLTGCVSARISDQASDRLFRDGRYEEAAEHLKQGAIRQGENGKDLLLYLLDMGIALHTAGKYEESNQAFLKAERIAEIKDYTSLATEGGTLLVGDNAKSYKGEDFEKVLINTYLAMNFALMGDREGALVEARKVNSILYRMVNEGKRKYKESAFARYLSAVLYESDRSWNDAYVDYKKTYQIAPSHPGLGRDLWRMAWLLGMRDEMERWDREFGLTEEDHKAAKDLHPKNGKAEIIVIYENGISPVKRPNPQFASLPKFYPRFNPVAEAEVTLNGATVGRTHLLEDIEATAIQNLEEKYGALVAKKLGGVVAKEVVSSQIERYTNNSGLGALARLALYASDRADLRSWSLLPRDLQIARIVVEPGTYDVGVSPIGADSLPARTIQVEAGRKVFVSFRYMPPHRTLRRIRRF